MTRTLTLKSCLGAALVASSLLAGCASGDAAVKSEPAPAAAQAPAAPAGPTPEEARTFVKKVNEDLKVLWSRGSTADWIKSTYITDDTEQNAAWRNEEVMAYLAGAIKEAARFDGLELDPETARMLHLLKISSTLPAPNDPQKRAELAATAAKLEGMYGKGKYCGPLAKKLSKKTGKDCLDLEDLSTIMAESRDPAELEEAWTGWHAIAPPMKPLYEKLVTLGNEGAREIGFQDLGALWRSGYDMSPEAFEQESQRLWSQVKPMYDELHCYVRGRLAKKYGEQRVPAGQPLPAHLLGNMWAQEWNNVYDLMEPYPGQGSLDVNAALRAKLGVKSKDAPLTVEQAQQMVKIGESFFTSIGLKPLPKTFWERSQFIKPRDREVVCHASAWDVSFSNDLRIKMCIKPTEEDLVTIHHELGHDYYYTYYYQLPVLFQQGAHDGFHEAIGDALTLSITPGYLQQLGLLKELPKSDKGLINLQMKDAIEKVAFLPFGLLVDQWRWDVLSGKVKPDQYEQHWLELRERLQGVRAPGTRPADAFDPGAKYHVPANVPYTRYFLARVLQFQFHKALCEAAGFKGPLHECSIYGNKEAGKKMQAMLAMGASHPWPDALEAMTGQRQMDATPMLEYFSPLRRWLQEQNKGQKCGW